MANATNEASLPHMVDIDVFGTPKSQVNWNAISVSSAHIFNGRLISSGAQNDEITWSVTLKKGTWTAEAMFIKNTTEGIIHVEIDGVEEGTIDAYAASLSYNNLGSLAGIAIDGSGSHDLTLKMASKNASSSGYALALSAIRLIRTGD